MKKYYVYYPYLHYHKLYTYFFNENLAKEAARLLDGFMSTEKL